MHRRNRNIILFFEENENVRSITSKMVRLYMNRFIIDEEQRFEITGVFNLAKVPEEPPVTVERGDQLYSLEDRQLIKDAFEKLKIFTWLSTDVYIFMASPLGSPLESPLESHPLETSFYLRLNNLHYDYLHVLVELVRNMVERCSSSTSISMTLLSGENYELHTKNEVQILYRETTNSFNLLGQRFLFDFVRPQSLNDDLENLFSRMISKNYFYSQIFTRKTRWLKTWLKLKLKQEVRKLFLFEMLRHFFTLKILSHRNPYR